MPRAHITHDNIGIVVNVSDSTIKPVIVSINLGGDTRITELRDMLFRAANTLDPNDTPAWVTDLLDVLDGVPR